MTPTIGMARHQRVNDLTAESLRHQLAARDLRKWASHVDAGAVSDGMLAGLVIGARGRGDQVVATVTEGERTSVGHGNSLDAAISAALRALAIGHEDDGRRAFAAARSVRGSEKAEAAE